MRQARAGMSLIELMIVIVAIIAAIAIPSLLVSQRNAAELSTVASLRTLTTASTDFRVAVQSPITSTGLRKRATGSSP
jgi:type II secretory pathway pseudopilin PulG